MIRKTFLFKSEAAYKRFMDKVSRRVYDANGKEIVKRAAMFNRYARSSANRELQIERSIKGTNTSSSKPYASAAKDALIDLVNVSSNLLQYNKDSIATDAAKSHRNNFIMATKKFKNALDKYKSGFGYATPSYDDILKSAEKLSALLSF